MSDNGTSPYLKTTKEINAFKIAWDAYVNHKIELDGLVKIFGRTRATLNSIARDLKLPKRSKSLPINWEEFEKMFKKVKL